MNEKVIKKQWKKTGCADKNQVRTSTLLGNIVRLLVSCVWHLGFTFTRFSLLHMINSPSSFHILVLLFFGLCQYHVRYSLSRHKMYN